MLTFADREAKIFVKSITFSAGQTITLDDSSILVIVGPNNAGKSSTLREIRDHLLGGYRVGPVLKGAEIRVRGTIEAFKKAIVEAGLATGKQDVIRINDYTEYELSKVNQEIKDGFVGSKVVPFFVSFLNSEERLRSPIPRRGVITSEERQKTQCNGWNWTRKRRRGLVIFLRRLSTPA